MNGDRRVDRIEWVVGAVSAVLVLGVLGYLILLGVRGSNAVPDLAVIATPGDPGQMRFSVFNRGERTASNVTLALRLETDTGAPERRRLTIDFVPAHSKVSGVFLLDAAELATARLIIESYLDP